MADKIILPTSVVTDILFTYQRTISYPISLGLIDISGERCSETLVSIYQTPQRHIPENRQRRDNLQSHNVLVVFREELEQHFNQA
jgi:hypothetical protein